MKEFGLQHPMDYREEIAKPFFERIQRADSFAIIGGGSMGKTRLLDFVTRPEVQQYYLKDEAAHTLLLRTDCNRARKVSEWGLYEMLLTSIVEGCDQTRVTRNVRTQINNDLRQPVILKEDNALLALRHLELAVRHLTHECSMRVGFLLDEFDEMFARLDPTSLANLRGIRDANKNQLCYGLFFRHASEKIRDVSDSESFYELFSRRQMGLKPYTEKDARRMLAQLEDRNKRTLSPAAQIRVIDLSGGHPGLLSALFDLTETGETILTNEKRFDDLLEIDNVNDECNKLWRSLNDEEKEGIKEFLKGLPLIPETRRWLELKGLLMNDGGFEDLFSPVFRKYVERL
jgi:hypothetical protein